MATELQSSALRNLEQIVAIDSASDERSQTIPTTPGQTRLADHLAAFFAELGAEVERDAFANIIATLPGRGRGVGQAPVALMVHLDTARGTAPLSALNVMNAWDGRVRIPYPKNPTLNVEVATYPATAAFVGQDVVFGGGDAPFGLDDKLGLAHLMSLAQMLKARPQIAHPPLLIIGRPDEEVGRMEALYGLAKTLAERGVRFGYTIDGIAPFEINVENFNAAGAAARFTDSHFEAAPTAASITVQLGGVNTHGATAKAEGHRAATRFAAEIVDALIARELAPNRVAPIAFETDALRDCDATVRFATDGTTEAAAALSEIVESIVGPHVSRGASFAIATPGAGVGAPGVGVWAALRYITAFRADGAVSPLLAEDSEGRQGYSHPYRIEAEPEAGEVRLDLRLRDFDAAGLEARKAHVRAVATAGVKIELHDQYENMAPRLAGLPELVEWPRQAAAKLGIEAPVQPIRGGTGVDPFLDAGVLVANLGTGYFAPESEKEFTSLQLMTSHAEWLVQLVQDIVVARA